MCRPVAFDNIATMVSTFDAGNKAKMDPVPHADTIRNSGSIGLSTLDIGEFIGREEELTMINERIENGVNPIIISGFGGIGKTELVIEYGRRKSSSHRIIFVRFKDNFRKTIIDQIAGKLPGYSKYLNFGVPKPEEQIFQEVFQELQRFESNTILIIDNVDDDNQTVDQVLDDTFWELCELSFHIIITTRYQSDFDMITLGSLKLNQLYSILQKSIELSKPEMNQIIDAVQGHTLAIDLIGKTLKYSIPKLNLSELLEFLRKDTKLKTPRIMSKKDRSIRKISIDEHIRKLFKFASLSTNELCCLQLSSFIPETGIDIDTFYSLLPEENRESLELLIGKGWIGVSQRTLTPLHLLIRSVVQKEDPLPKNSQTLHKFTNNIISYSKKADNCNAKIIRQMSLLIEQLRAYQIMDKETDHIIYWISMEWTFSECISIIKHLPKGLLGRIPWRLCSVYKNNASNSYSTTWLDNMITEGTTWEQEILPGTAVTLSLIYRDFLVDEQEHNRLLKKDGITEQDSLRSVFKINDSKQRYSKDYICDKTNLVKILRILERYDEAIDEQKKIISSKSIIDINKKTENDYLTLSNLFIDAQRYDEAIGTLLGLIDFGNVVAINNMGWMILKGYTHTRDVEKAISYFKLAADYPNKKPSIAACKHLGKLYLGVHPDASDYQDISPLQALEYLRKAKALGDDSVNALIEQANSLIKQ